MSQRTLIQGGWVLSLGADTPNLVDGDVLIDAGRIAEIGRGLRARDADVVDAADCIVMPGFVDTHRHAWTALLRGTQAGATHPAPALDGRDFRPDDVYAATLLGLHGAAETGITTVVDWADVPPSDEHLRAVLEAHADAGLRTVLVLVVSGGTGHDAVADVLRRRVADHTHDSMTTLAFGSADPTGGGLDEIEADWALARDLGLRIHAHVGTDPDQRGVVAAIAARGLLGDDVTLVHATHLGEDDLDAIASHGATVSLTPSSEMSGGLGTPPLQELIDRRIRPGLGVDRPLLAPGDLFAQMRATQSVQHARVFDLKLAGKAGLPHLLSTREVIRYATADGARTAGLATVTGSIEVGKRADVIVLRADRPNIFPINDPIGAVVWGMDASNVDSVLVDGRALMRGGELATDTSRVRELALAAQRRITADAGLLVESSDGAGP